jgi:hypothetical protein
MMKNSALAIILTALALSGCPQLSQAQEKQRIPMKDSLDGALDLSYFLASAYGFLPFVMPITEPAVGYGAAGGPIFIHRDMEALKRGEHSPPSLTMVGGMYTENGTWGLLGIHSGVWKKDHIRYLGGIFYASANLTYYPPKLPGLDIDFTLKASGIIQQIAFRMGEIKLFGGVRYQFINTRVSLTEPPLEGIIEPWEYVNKLGLGGPVLFVDYRDNSFTPSKGTYAKASYYHSAPWLGSDVTFDMSQIYATWFSHPTSWLVTGLRGDFQSSWGDIPFFSKPFVNLRGIPAMRYQNFNVLTFETEERFDLTPRWSLTAFGGVAKAFDMEKNFSDFDWVYNYGAGFRYKIARLFGIYSGVDFGFGPDGSWAFYVVFGHAWNRS